MHSLLPLLVLCFSVLCLTTRTNADDLRFYIYYECPSNMNYTRRSAFQANLDATISSLPAAAAASYGFAENATGAAPDEAYGLAQCRGDINASECRSCLADSDFVLARLFNMDSSVGNTKRVAGTYGYMAPEYALRGIFSTKSDVYSYGVLVLEIVTGRRPSENLINFVWGHWSRGSVPQLLEGCPAGDDGPGPQETLRCIHVGLLCVQDDPQLRPSMASVVVMLNSRSITLPAPTEPAFAFVMNPGEGPRAPPQEPSINDASVSDLNPR